MRVSSIPAWRKSSLMCTVVVLVVPGGNSWDLRGLDDLVGHCALDDAAVEDAVGGVDDDVGVEHECPDHERVVDERGGEKTDGQQDPTHHAARLVGKGCSHEGDIGANSARV